MHYDTQVLKEMLQSVSFDDSVDQSRILASLKRRDEMKFRAIEREKGGGVRNKIKTGVKKQG